MTYARTMVSPPDLAHAVKQLQARHHRAISEGLAPLELSLPQWDALRHLHQHPDASLHDLAVLTFQTDQAFGGLAARMIDRGLIERLPGPGRAVRHRLTAEGERVRREGAAVVEAVSRRSFAPLTAAERDLLGGLLDRLLEKPTPTTDSRVAQRKRSATEATRA